MEKPGVLTRGLALVGATLAWLPFLAPIGLSFVQLARIGELQVDYLMPAELFPAAFLGGVLLLLAAIRARSHRSPIAWSLAAAICLLIACMVLAQVTGLASGDSEAQGWRLGLVAGSFVAYTLALVVLAVSGASLVRALLDPPPLRQVGIPPK